MRIEDIRQGHPMAKVGLIIQGRVGEDRPPEEEIEVRRDLLDFGLGQPLALMA
jgi:hypothetical protein